MELIIAISVAVIFVIGMVIFIIKKNKKTTPKTNNGTSNGGSDTIKRDEKDPNHVEDVEGVL